MLDISPEYQRPALDLLDFCGVDPTNFPSSSTPGIPSSYGLRSMVLFPAEDWQGKDTLIANRTSAESWAEWLALTPFSQAARDAIIRIQTDTTTDWIVHRDGPKTVEEKLHILTHITYKRYLMDYLGAPEEAIVQYQRTTHGLIGVGAQAATAADVWLLGTPGFAGLGLPDPTDLTFPGIGRTAQQDNMSASGPSVAWPDGNASLVRLLVSKLIPDAFPDVDGDRPNQETIVKARCDYSQLDRRGRRTRIRLNSYVYKVRAGRRANDFASVEYVDRHGKGHRVFGAHVVMACWNRVTAQIVEDLSRPQREGLCYARKGPLIYGRAALNNWQAWADAKIASISPRGNSLFWDSTSISAGAKFGNSYGPTPNGPPSAPAMLTFQVLPTDPTRTPKLAASERGREKLLQMSFRDLENALIDVIDRSVNKSGGDFEPERDIDSIVMNRWNYGYAAEHQAVWDEAAFLPFKDQPQRKGCVPFRNVAIGNSDSQAMAYTHAAIQEGYRAVHDLPPTRCRPKGRH